MATAVRVECYSGSKYGERPLAFTLDARRYEVKLVEKSWRTPLAVHFRVRTENDESFELAYYEKANSWQVERVSAAAQE